MSRAHEPNHDLPAAQAATQQIREEIARRRISRQTLAEEARISLSTLEKGLSGRRPFTLATLVRLEQALGLPLRTRTKASAGLGDGPADTAADEVGGYNRASVAWLEGAYLTLRPSVSEPGSVYAYRTDIGWDREQVRLIFREAERVDRDFSQFGHVTVPRQSGHIYLVTNRHGQHRLAVVGRPVVTGEMFGLLTTLQAGRGAHLSPLSAPIVLKPLRPGETAAFGRIGAGHPSFAGYRALLRRTIDGHFASVLLP